MATMLVTEDTPSKLILKTDPSLPHFNPLTWGGCVKPTLTVTAVLIAIVIMIWIRTSFFITTDKWLFPIVIIGAAVGEVLLIAAVAFSVFIHRDRVKEATVSIDADLQRAIRIETLNSGKINQQELKFAEVTHILIHGDDAGHRLNVTLESKNNPSFQVNSDVFFDSQPMIEFGKKLGTFIQKPVVFKITDVGEPVSEETIQG